MQFSQPSELPQQAAKDTMPHTGQSLFCSTALPKNHSDSLPRPPLAIRAVGRPPGLPTKRSRKARRVLYPARVRKYLPRPKKDGAKRWLLVCAGIVLLQVQTEEPEREGLAGGKVPKERLCTLHAQLRAAHLGAAQLRAAENCSRETELLQRPRFSHSLISLWAPTSRANHGCATTSWEAAARLLQAVPGWFIPCRALSCGEELACSCPCPSLLQHRQLHCELLHSSEGTRGLWMVTRGRWWPGRH